MQLVFYCYCIEHVLTVRIVFHFSTGINWRGYIFNLIFPKLFSQHKRYRVSEYLYTGTVIGFPHARFIFMVYHRSNHHMGWKSIDGKSECVDKFRNNIGYWTAETTYCAQRLSRSVRTPQLYFSLLLAQHYLLFL